MGYKIMRPIKMTNKNVYYIFLGGRKTTEDDTLYEHIFEI